MEKKGIWNFFGLTSRRNLLELEEQIRKLDENSRQRQIELAQFIKSQNTVLNDNLLQIEGNIKNLSRRIYNLEQNQAKSVKEIKELSEKIRDELVSSDINLDNRNEKRKKEIMNRIRVYDGILTETDLGLRKVLEQYMEVLYSIVYRIDNMDPVVNMEKIESLLKMLVINDMMDEMDKMDKISEKKTRTVTTKR